jgi:hypothetical protein
MVTIPAFIPGPEWDTRGKASLAPTQEELVLWTPSRSIAAASSGSAGLLPEDSSQFAPESAVRDFIASYRTPVPAQSPPSTPGLSASSGEASEIISPTPRLPNKARPAWIEPADHLQNVTGPFRADPMFQAADEILRVHEGVDRRSASAPAEFVDLTTPTPPLPPLPSGRPDPDSISAGAQRWYQEQRELEEYMGTPPADWTVHYLVLSRLAARKEMARARPQQERDFEVLQNALEDLHVHMEKTTAALEASHRRRMETMTENHRKDLLDLHQQLRKDAQIERESQAEIYRNELRELRKLLSNQTAERKPTPPARLPQASPRPQPLPKPSQFTALKAPEQPQVRPAGILKRPGPNEPPDLISFSPAPDKMEIEGVLAESMWAPSETYPERIPQVVVVSPVHSPKRQGRDAGREGKPEAPTRQEPSAARVGSRTPMRQESGAKREGDCQAPMRQESGAERGGDRQAPMRQESGEERGGDRQAPMRQESREERGGDRQAPMRQESGEEREGSGKGAGAMVDVQTQTQGLGRSRSRGRRFNRSRTPLPYTSAVPRTYAAVAAQVATPNPNLSGTNRTPLGPRPTMKPEPGKFWIQLVFPGVDDGSRSAEDFKNEIRANKVTNDVGPRVSQFQYANRTVLSKRNLGGWYTSFCIPRDGGEGGAKERRALQAIRKQGLKIFGFTVRPYLAERANPGTFCPICCGYGHGAWSCHGRPARCTFCSGAHPWARHRCGSDGCSSEKGVWCQAHEALCCLNCGRDHAAGDKTCSARPQAGNGRDWGAASGTGGRRPRNEHNGGVYRPPTSTQAKW